MKEYGSNVQKLADYLVALQDREKRTLYAHILVELMRQIHPNMRDGQDYSQKLWDDLYIMADFALDVDSPFPPPSPEAVGKKPLRVPYNQSHIRYKQYGKNLLLLVQKAIDCQDKEEKLAFISYLIRQMRTFYNTWNKDNPDDNIVFTQLDEVSGGRLKEELAYLRQNGLVESTPRDKGTNVERYQRNLQNNRGSFNSNNNNRERSNNTNNNRNNNSNSNNNNNNRNRDRDRDRDKFRSNKNNRKR
ncbi:DUF4290 domain-containing protein [Runella sp.]|uniref:DUF4290 domain-containing protein n=1 Tax=Runella sp. TaxID=1960881 RepID=UPI003D0A9880